MVPVLIPGSILLTLRFCPLIMRVPHMWTQFTSAAHLLLDFLLCMQLYTNQS